MKPPGDAFWQRLFQGNLLISKPQFWRDRYSNNFTVRAVIFSPNTIKTKGQDLGLTPNFVK
jgi:hypothetical protein